MTLGRGSWLGHEETSSYSETMAILRRTFLGRACVPPPACVLGLEMEERMAAKEVVERAGVAGGGKLLGNYCVEHEYCPPHL